MAYRNREEEKLERREQDAQRGDAPAGDKPKKSWKEIDMQRDGSRTGSREDKGPRQKGESPAYRAYKSKLGRLFEQGAPVQAVVVEVVRGQDKAPLLPKVAEEAPPPVSPKEMLKAAANEAEITRAAQACLAAGGLPLDAELLLKVLTLKDETLLLPALEAVLDAMEKGRPKNHKALVAQLALCPLTDPVAIDIAKGIVARLG